MAKDGYYRHTPVLSGTKVIRALSIDGALLPHVSDLVTHLTDSWRWLEVGDSVPDVIAECKEALESWYQKMFIGQISSFLGALPDGWLLLDGSTYDEADYPELWSVLDAQFKDEPSSTFTLPDFGGLVLVSSGNGFVVGDVGGLDAVTLSIAELPSHTHNYQQVIIDIDVKTVGAPDPTGARFGAMVPTSATGGDASHENMQPYFTVVMGILAGRA